jgi:cytochrome c5
MTHVPPCAAALAALLALAGCQRESSSSTASSAPGTPVASASASVSNGQPLAVGSSGTSASASASAGSELGQAVYTQTCVACHGTGLAGAPKIGDKADWGPRIAKGKASLYEHAIKGFTGSKGTMPPKGGSPRPDSDIKAAVDYMVSQAK